MSTDSQLVDPEFLHRAIRAYNSSHGATVRGASSAGGYERVLVIDCTGDCGQRYDEEDEIQHVHFSGKDRLRDLLQKVRV